MNTQNVVDKTINIIDFTICGVEGFKTVCAAGGSAQKRMFSALNNMHRKFKDEDKRLHDLEAAGTIGEEHSKVRYALRLVTTIKDRFMQHGDSAQLVTPDNPNSVVSLTTAQFLTETNWIYEQNIATFLNKLSEIDTAINKHAEKVSQEIDTRKKPYVGDVTPLLCICNGGILGTKPFYLFMTELSIRELGQGDLSKAVQYFVSRAIIAVKNFRLTDYLRFSGEAQEKVKQELLFLDDQLDRLGEVRAEVVPYSVFSISTVGNCRNKSAYEKIIETSNMLFRENELRLNDYVVGAYGNIQLAKAS